MIKKLLFTLLLFSIGFTSANAALGVIKTNTTETVVPKQSNQLDLLKAVQGNLLKQEASVNGLTRKQKRLLKKVNRKIKRAEKRANSSGDRSWVVTAVLSFFLGVLGIDRFYLGYTTLGLIKLLTAGGLGIWYLIDLILIITRVLQPVDGDYTD